MEIKMTYMLIDDLEASGEAEGRLHSWRGKIFLNIGDNPPYMFVAHGKCQASVYSYLGSSVSDFRDGCRAMGAPENVLAYLTELSVNLYRASTAIVTHDTSPFEQATGGYNG